MFREHLFLHWLIATRNMRALDHSTATLTGWFSSKAQCLVMMFLGPGG
jgi:hypothetical protein